MMGWKHLTAFMVSLMLALPTYAQDDGKTAITTTPIELNSENPQQKLIGKLKYIKGDHLTSDDDDFGGISSLGHWFQNSEYNTVNLITDKADFATLIIYPEYILRKHIYVTKLINLPQELRPKIAGDAEAISKIIIGENKYFIVAFEQRHRIIAYNTKGGETPLPLPANIDMLQANGGLETMEVLSDGRLLLMAEHPTLKTNQHFGWIGTAPKDDPLAFQYETRLIAPPKGYSPTDATELPNGDVLVLLRRFTPTDGVSAKFWRIKKSMLDSSDTITGEVIATLAPPLTVDNMEGIAVIDVSKDGNPIIAVISDDNFNSFQRTLLMIFEILP